MLVAVYADENDQIFEDERFWALARMGDSIVEIDDREFIPLPVGSSLMVLPQRLPIGLSRLTGNFSTITDRGQAVAALLPQGYTRTLLPAAVALSGSSVLPLFGYTAVAWHVEEQRFYVAAVLTDTDKHKWQPHNYNTTNLAGLITAAISRYPDNRILSQLAHCAEEYGCFTAQNIFYQRWEAGIPVSPKCNAQCVGCISEQVADCCPSPQQRINFIPTLPEVVEVMLAHLSRAPGAIVSFGQGCEGEPLLQANLISQAIKMVRSDCTAGIININTNAGHTAGVKQVCQAGVDMLRVSMISAIAEHYHAYYRPTYTLEDVKRSLKIAKEHDVFVSLNWLTMPGITDTEPEITALIQLIREYRIDMLQLRNLNLDPDQYRHIYPGFQQQSGLGIIAMLEVLRQELPNIVIGNFTLSEINP